MRIAKDGKPFHIDNIGELGKGEVEIIQFLRPNGTRRRLACEVGKEIAEKAKNFIISAEQLTTGEIAIYCRRVEEPIQKEKMRFAVNDAGENSPQKVLKKLIIEVSNVSRDNEKEG